MLLAEAVLLTQADGRVEFLPSVVVLLVAQSHDLVERVHALVGVCTASRCRTSIVAGRVRRARGLHLAYFSNKLLELLHAEYLLINDLLGVLVYPIVGVQLFLELDYCLVPLVQPRSKCDHYVSLLQKELFVPVDLGLLFLDLGALSLHLLQLQLVLLPDQLLLLFQQGAELWRLLDFLTTNQHL